MQLQRKLGDQVGQGWTLYAIAFVDCDCNRLEYAVDHLRQAANLFQANGTRDGESATLVRLGDILRRNRLFADATHVLQQALAIFTSLGDRDGQGLTLFTLGESHRDADDSISAIRCFREGRYQPVEAIELARRSAKTLLGFSSPGYGVAGC